MTVKVRQRTSSTIKVTAQHGTRDRPRLTSKYVVEELPKCVPNELIELIEETVVLCSPQRRKV
jgi:hypothetical protein